jgi:hypothetical protein
MVLVFAAASAVPVGWVVIPGSDWALSYFSSSFQGFAALLGIALAGTSVNFQLAVQEYGTVIGARLLFSEKSSAWCLVSLALVVALSGLALVLAPLSETVLRLGAVAVFAGSVVAGFQLWQLLRRFSLSLTPRAVVARIVEEWLSRAEEALEGDGQEVVGVMHRLARGGPSVSGEAVEGFADAARRALGAEDALAKWAALRELTRNVLQSEELWQELAARLLDVVYDGIRMQWAGIWSLAGPLADVLADRNRFPAMQRVLRAHLANPFVGFVAVKRTRHAWMQRGSPGGADAEAQRLARVHLASTEAGAALVLFWWRNGQYRAILKVLEGESDILEALPKDEDPRTFVQDLCDGLCLDRQVGPKLMLRTAHLADCEGHAGETEIARLVSLGIVQGYPDGRFRPDDLLTRAEFVTLLVRTLDGPVSYGMMARPKGNSFADGARHWARKAIERSVELSLVGPEDAASGRFHPNRLVRWGELCQMVERGVQSSESVAAASERSSTPGRWSFDGSVVDRHRPDAPIRRADAALVLSHLIDRVDTPSVSSWRDTG